MSVSSELAIALSQKRHGICGDADNFCVAHGDGVHEINLEVCESNPSVAISPREETLIIFDFDDTLFPTTWMKTLNPMDSQVSAFVSNIASIFGVKVSSKYCLSSKVMRSFTKSERSGRWPMRTQAISRLPGVRDLRRHATVVRDLLRIARSLGHVAVVTLAPERWLTQTLEGLLPGEDIQALLDEFDVPVYHAKSYGVPKQDSQVELKRRAMAACLSDLASISIRNVISVGDSIVERKAIKELLQPEVEAFATLCKTLKLLKNPSCAHLTEELSQLLQVLPLIACAGSNFDVRVKDPTCLEASVLDALGKDLALSSV